MDVSEHMCACVYVRVCERRLEHWPVNQKAPGLIPGYAYLVLFP